MFLFDVRSGAHSDLSRTSADFRFGPIAEIRAPSSLAKLSVELIVQPDAHDVVGEMGVSNLTGTITTHTQSQAT
jgi:hypothetical protein